MKILSRYKDYYDYLISKYGVDDKIVLDRNKFDNKTKPTKGEKVTIFFCDHIVEGISTDNDIIYGEQILIEFESNRKYKILNDEFYYKVYLTEDQCSLYGSSEYNILKSPIYMGDKSPNRIFNCPILYYIGYASRHKSLNRIDEIIKESETRFAKFPILNEFNFHKVFSPEDAYINLYNWLTKEKQIEELSDKIKIIKNGFDIKTSFRKM